MAGFDRGVNVRTFTVGGDVERGALLGGIAVSHSTGEGGFRFLGDGAAGARPGDDAESTLTGIYPYARFAGQRLSLWGVFGNAQGSLSLTGSGIDVDADVDAGMGAIGMRGLWFDAGAVEVAVKSDMLRTWMTGVGDRLAEVDADVNRFRVLLEASGSSALAGGRFTSSLELGLRHDSGSVDPGAGVELGGRLRYVGERRLTLAAAGRVVATHGAEAFGEWGLSGSVLYAPQAVRCGRLAAPGAGVGHDLECGGADVGGAGPVDAGPPRAARIRRRCGVRLRLPCASWHCGRGTVSGGRLPARRLDAAGRLARWRRCVAR